MSSDTVDNIYEAPESDLVVDDEELKELFTVSIRKLVLMQLFTFGLYSLVWFYEHWKQQKIKHQLRVIPALRAFFYIFFIHSLFGRIGEAADRKGLSTDWSPGTDASAWVGLIVVAVVLNFIGAFQQTDELWIFLATTLLNYFLPLIFTVRAQKVANLINEDEEGAANSSLSVVNFIWMIVCTLYYGVIVLGTIVSFLAV